MKGLVLTDCYNEVCGLSSVTEDVIRLRDAVEDATTAEEFLRAARKFAPYGMYGDGWQIDRVTDSYVRLKGVKGHDRGFYGQIYLKAKFASRSASMKKRADYFDSMCMMTGYQPQTSFWDDFSIADAFGGDSAIKDTFNRAFAEWKSDCVYLTELVMVLNWKSWQWSERGDYARSELYVKLWEKADAYACGHLKGEELSYFLRTTD